MKKMIALLLALTLPTTRALLKLMGTPEEQMGYAYDYIFIIFIGIPATILYNMGACVLRSLGDSKSPVWFLAIASVINIVLDLLTVCVLGMGVAGAAIATVVSQLGSGVLCVWYMRKHFEVLRMEKDDWRLRKTEVLRLLGMGVPVGLQFSITAIGSVMLQSAVNSLGAVCVSGVAVASKIYMLLCCPFDALAMAATNFTGQNLGAGKYDRIRQGTYACLLLGIIYCAIYIVIARFGTQYLVLLFMNADEAQSVLDYTQRISYAYAYGTPLLLGVNVFRLSIQGMGYSRLSLISGLLEMIARTAVGIWGVPQFGFAAACLASPLAWALADCFLIPAYYGCLNARRRQAARSRSRHPFTSTRISQAGGLSNSAGAFSRNFRKVSCTASSASWASPRMASAARYRRSSFSFTSVSQSTGRLDIWGIGPPPFVNLDVLTGHFAARR